MWWIECVVDLAVLAFFCVRSSKQLLEDAYYEESIASGDPERVQEAFYENLRLIELTPSSEEYKRVTRQRWKTRVFST